MPGLVQGKNLPGSKHDNFQTFSIGGSFFDEPCDLSWMRYVNRLTVTRD